MRINSNNFQSDPISQIQHARGSILSKGPIKSLKKKQLKLNRVFKEREFQAKITKRIKKKSKKPFKNLRKILNVMYQYSKPEMKRINFEGNIEPELNILYLIMYKLILDNQICTQTSLPQIQGS
jgi:hypothetical protein